MLGFHRRQRSLIPVKDLAKYDKLPVVWEEEEEETDCKMSLDAPEAGQKQLTLIYIVFLAEAIMAASLQPQLKMLLSTDDFCGDLSSSYLRSILDCAYAFGGTAGILWGCLADRVGRRPVALAGLFGMSICCMAMGLATSLGSCAVFRFVAGLVSSAVTVTALTMIGDISSTPVERAVNVARLPLVAVCGSIGPLVQGMVAGRIKADGAVWQKFPALSNLAYAGDPSESMDMDCEKAAFLGQANDDIANSVAIRIVDCVKPEPISIGQFIQAPSLLTLLASFSLLSLHASTFDVLLPHAGHSSTQHGGMGIPCSWLEVTVLLVRAIAGLVVLRTLLLLFPAIYVLTPALAYLVACSTTLTALISTASILTKHILANSAQTLVALLMLNAAPDAFSAGTIVGLMQVASLFKALAVAVSGASFYLSDDLSVAATNCALWSALSFFGVAGAALAWFVRESPSVERDFPAEVLKWETCFDAEGLGSGM
ncbi:hypothetical protein H2199_002570 [Coniosporium tulheliwenetii]|uniref:Uncharacterized protein n=1 Tax=Coniosporium tulheliwenetii TaxID=3383036 RepID=A0ACC2ZGW9_9PEZI|nr:hypothetical protein H2199_002570 [Cladosporium sp. JES 115]